MSGRISPSVCAHCGMPRNGNMKPDSKVEGRKKKNDIRDALGIGHVGHAMRDEYTRLRQRSLRQRLHSLQEADERDCRIGGADYLFHEQPPRGETRRLDVGALVPCLQVLRGLAALLGLQVPWALPGEARHCCLRHWSQNGAKTSDGRPTPTAIVFWQRGRGHNHQARGRGKGKK